MDGVNTRKSPGYRAAMAAVIILSALLVLGVLALAAGFARQYRLMHAGPAETGTASAASVTLAPGAHIVSAGSDAGKLILHVATPTGSEVDVMDLATGKLTSQVKDGPR
jgi:amino acid transporter